MALLYRAIWQDDRSELVQSAGDAFLAWLSTKRLAFGALPHDYEVQAGKERFWLTSREAEVDSVHSLQCRLVEERSNGETWTTTFTSLEQAEHPGGWLWVDVDRTSKDPFERPPFSSPRLVRDLIATGADPRAGQVRLTTTAGALPAGPLNGLIRSDTRRLPLVVFAHDEAAGVEGTMRRADAALERLAGVAQVFVLPADQVQDFNELVGEDLGVWDGAVRVYLPNSGSGGLRPQRHRYVTRSRFDRHEGAAGDIIVRLLAPSITATAPPDLYRAVARALSSAGPVEDQSELLELAMEESDALRQETEQLRAQLGAMEEELLDLQAETAGLQEELNRSTGLVSSLMSGSFGVDAAAASLPVEVTSIREAIEAASQLTHLVMSPDAPRDIDKLDQSLEGPKWANMIWRALRALDSYAADEDRPAGGFWEWCKVGGSAWNWPATTKKLSMRESQTVMNNDRLRSARSLPVDPRLDPSGKVTMEAHIKISEGGGMLAPRIYFHDDTSGATGYVHIGYLGPHEHMPNTRTN